MSYTPELPSGIKIIDDSSRIVPRRERGELGFVNRDYYSQPFGSVAKPLSGDDLIPREEWYDRAVDLQENKTSLIYTAKKLGWEIKNQRSIPYCWVFGVTSAAEICGMMQGHEYVKLSPSSVGAKVKNFRLKGGWGDQAAEYAAVHGWVPQDLWPETAVKRQYDTQENWTAAKRYVLSDWNELRPRSLDDLYSCILRGIPVPVGFNWWGHLVCGLDMVPFKKPKGLSDRDIINSFGLGIANSWGEGWSAGGYGVLRGSKQIPDGQVAIRSMTLL
jgi:hypothetical protein